MPSLKALAELCQVVRGMEEDLGIGSLSDFDKRVLLSIVREGDSTEVAKTKTVLGDCAKQGISRPTVFRSLKTLSALGYIEQVKHGGYRAISQ